jgi:hypothetical protein
MVWQLRLVAFVTGLMVVALTGGATWGCWMSRPRSRQEARERRARIRRINRKEEQGYVSRDDLIEDVHACGLALRGMELWGVARRRRFGLARSSPYRRLTREPGPVGTPGCRL